MGRHTVAFGLLAPVIAFTRLFAAQGIDLGLDEARGPMGTEKREHIRCLCALPRIAAAWRDLYGESPDEATIDRLYHEFVPLQVTAIRDHAQPVPGCRETGWEALPVADQRQRRERAHQRLLAGCAHYAINSIADLPRCLDAIEARLARGARP